MHKDDLAGHSISSPLSGGLGAVDYLEVDAEQFTEGNGGQDTYTRGQGQHQPAGILKS